MQVGKSAGELESSGDIRRSHKPRSFRQDPTASEVLGRRVGAGLRRRHGPPNGGNRVRQRRASIAPSAWDPLDVPVRLGGLLQIPTATTSASHSYAVPLVHSPGRVSCRKPCNTVMN